MNLVATNLDMAQERVVSREEGKRLASELGIEFYETSAKLDIGVDEAFLSIIRFVTAMRSTSIVFNPTSCRVAGGTLVEPPPKLDENWGQVGPRTLPIITWLRTAAVKVFEAIVE